MGNVNLTPDQLQALLQYASKRLGTTPENLARTVQSGGLEGISKNLSPNESAKLNSLLGNREQAQELLNSPEVQSFLQQILQK